MFPFDTIVNSPTILFNHKAVRESESILKCAQACAHLVLPTLCSASMNSNLPLWVKT